MIPPVSLPPFMIQLKRQSGTDTDCVVAALATLLGLTYQQALIHCATISPDVLSEGMTCWEAKRAARLAGIKTKALVKFDVSDETGVLFVGKRGRVEHAVFLWAGRVCDGDGALWLEPDDYLRNNGYKPKALLIRTDE